MVLSGTVFPGLAGFGESHAIPCIPWAEEWDTLVVGGGPGGIPAAKAAARNAARVHQVVRYGFLGGIAEIAPVLPCIAHWADFLSIVRGLFLELLDQLEKHGSLLEDGRPFDDDSMKRLLDLFVLAVGIRPMFHMQAVGEWKRQGAYI
jgi:hypothetical protein